MRNPASIVRGLQPRESGTFSDFTKTEFPCRILQRGIDVTVTGWQMGATQGEGLLQGEQRRALCANHGAPTTLFKSNSKSHSKTSLTQWEPDLTKKFKLRPLIRTVTRGQRQQDIFHFFLTRMKLISMQKISLRTLPYLNSCKASVVHLSNHWLDS